MATENSVNLRCLGSPDRQDLTVVPIIGTLMTGNRSI